MDFSDISKRWIIKMSIGWKFKYFEKYTNDIELQSIDYNDSDWDEVDIPFAWENKGYGSSEKSCDNLVKNLNRKINKSTGIYEKTNFTGVYRKLIDIPDSWEDRNIFIKLGGVKSGVELWVNGTYVDFSFGTMSDIEFDVTEQVRKGLNIFVLKVQKYSNASFMDCSFNWFLSGILRELVIYSEPKIFINDLFIRSTFDDEYEDSRLCVETWVKNSTNENKDLKLELMMDEKLLMTAGFVVNKNSEEKVYICKLVEKPIKWDDENPYLYDVDIILKDYDGNVLSKRRIKHGFRQIEIRKSQFLVNGKPVLFKGINRVDYENSYSNDSNDEIMNKDIILLKQNNINAILTSDFPSDPKFYDLCDKYGIYVVSELGINTNFSIKKLPEEFDWNKVALERISKAVSRDKNHPSIIMWYLGKDTSCGLDYLALKDYLDDIDDSRPASYIGSTGSIGGDVLCTQYPTVKMEESIGELKSIRNFFKENKSLNESKSLKIGDYIKKPVFCSKLSYIEGNCLGNIHEHIINYEKYSNLCGGFISNMKDMGIEKDEGIEVLREGVIDIQGKPKPMFYELKKVFQNISTSMKEENGSIILEIENKYRTRTINEFLMEIIITENGNGIYNENVTMKFEEVDCKTSFEFKPEIEIKDACEYILTISWKFKEANEWAFKGLEVAWDQFVIFGSRYEGILEKEEKGIFTVLETEEFISIKSNQYSIIINKKTGNIKNINRGAGNILYKEIIHIFTRDETDVDKRSNKNNFRNILNRNTQWVNAMKKRKVISSMTEKYPDKVVVYFNIEYPFANNPSTLIYEIRNRCSILIHNEIEPLKEMPRFGMQFELPGHFDNITYYGKGPHENYVDRNRGSFICIHESTLKEFEYKYINEQESGNRTDIRWMKVDSEDRSIFLQAIGEKNFDFSVIQNKEKTVLNVDYGQKGVGGDISTGSEILKKYRLNKNNNYKYTFAISFEGNSNEV